MLKHKIFSLLLLLTLINFPYEGILAETDIPGGSVKGKWTKAGSPYNILGNIWVATGDTLIIEDGVEVFFQGTYWFRIYGLIQANGNANNMITFHGGGAVGSWKVISFMESATPGCILNYCIIKDGGYHEPNTSDLATIFIGNNDTNVTISNCDIYNCDSYGIYIQSYISTNGGKYITEECKPTIINNSIHENLGHGVCVQAFFEDTGGCAHYNTSIASPMIKNNLIFANGLTGIYCYTYADGGFNSYNNFDRNPTFKTNPKIYQNTIYGNGADGIKCRVTIRDYFGGTIVIEANPLINSNIISDNINYGLNANNQVSVEKVKYNDFWDNSQGDFSGIGGGLGVIVKKNRNGDPCDFNWNIYLNPEFEDETNYDFHLKGTSPCIDAGDLSLGRDPDGSYPEIGALWYDPTPRITSPNGGENWPVGVSQKIIWQPKNLTDNLKIEISKNAGNSWSTIINSTPNSGSYSWTPTSAYCSNSCLIRISSVANSAISDTSDAVFSITEQVCLWMPHLAGSHGGQITVPVYCIGLSGHSIYSANLVISYDASVVKAIDLDTTETFVGKSGWGMPEKNITTGQISIGMASTTPLDVSGRDKLIKIVFNIPGYDGDKSPLHFVSALFNEGDPAIDTTEDGSVTVVDQNLDIKGYIKYYAKQDAGVEDAIVRLTNAATRTDTTDANGYYEFLDLAPGNYKVTPQKDNDDRNAITAFDASKILRYIVGMETLIPYQKIAADVSGNGSISAYDASYILRYSIGLITSFPVRSDWTFVPHDYPISDANWFTSPRYRSYTPLISDQLEQNFWGILYGDVSGNWGGPVAAGSQTVIAFNLDNFQQTADRKWHMSLEMKFSDVAYSGGFKLLSNNPDLKFVSSSIDTSLTDNVLIASKTSTGEVIFAFASAQPLNEQPIKINLLFEEVKPATPSASDFESVDVIVDDKSTTATVVATQSSSQIPVDWDLGQNYPNPFNPETSTSFQVPKTSHIKIDVFNLLGQHIRTLVDEEKSPGNYQILWNGLDEQGQAVSSGVYLYKMQAGDFTAMKKMVLVR